MKKFFLSVLVVTASLTLSACVGGTDTDTPAAPTVETKQGDTTKSGTITQAGTQFFLNQPGQPLLHLDSYEVDFATYVGQEVTVTGQYSGDTLFVDELL